MTKIMLVEDDKSLREIYGVRLLAEGYDIVSAGDGEEALAMAIKERPHLIISDVMMPKVSGYDMLDILRSTTETKNIKIIMMTALSSEEQRNRAELLGADRYLVKSQVGIEDVIRVVHEVLGDKEGVVAPSAPQGTPQPPAPAQPPNTPGRPMPPPAQSQQSPVIPPMPKPTDPPRPASSMTRVLQPLNDTGTAPVNIDELLDKELAKEAGLTEEERPPVATAEQEKQQIAEQLEAYQPPNLTPVQPPETPQAGPEPAVPAQNQILPTPGVDLSSQNVTSPPAQQPAQPPVQPQAPQSQPATPAVPVQNTQPAPQPAPQPQSIPVQAPQQPVQPPQPQPPAPAPPQPLPEVPKV